MQINVNKFISFAGIGVIGRWTSQLELWPFSDATFIFAFHCGEIWFHSTHVIIPVAHQVLYCHRHENGSEKRQTWSTVVKLPLFHTCNPKPMTMSACMHRNKKKPTVNRFHCKIPRTHIYCAYVTTGWASLSHDITLKIIVISYDHLSQLNNGKVAEKKKETKIIKEKEPKNSN